MMDIIAPTVLNDSANRLGRARFESSPPPVLASRQVEISRSSPTLVTRGDRTVAVEMVNGQLVEAEASGDAPIAVQMPKPDARRESVAKPDRSRARSTRKSEHVDTAIKVATAKPRKQVTIESSMGRMRMKVDDYAISSSDIGGALVLCFSHDSDSTVYEPPVTDANNPLVVTVDDRSFKCLSGGWTVELQGLTMIFLVIVE